MKGHENFQKSYLFVSKITFLGVFENVHTTIIVIVLWLNVENHYSSVFIILACTGYWFDVKNIRVKNQEIHFLSIRSAPVKEPGGKRDINVSMLFLELRFPADILSLFHNKMKKLPFFIKCKNYISLNSILWLTAPLCTSFKCVEGRRLVPLRAQIISAFTEQFP